MSFRWRLAGATCRGQAHAALDRPNDDRFALTTLTDRFVLCVVADGAGSCANGGQGAECVVQAAVDFFRLTKPEELSSVRQWESLLRQCLQATRHQLELEAEASRVELGSLATTLQVILASEREIGRLQVGDGAAVAAIGEDLKLLTPPAQNEFVNETDFVTGRQYIERAEISVLSELSVSGIGVFSDGVTPLCVNLGSWAPHEPFFRPLFTHLRTVADIGDVKPALEALLNSTEAHRRSDDDRTLVLAVPAV